MADVIARVDPATGTCPPDGSPLSVPVARPTGQPVLPAAARLIVRRCVVCGASLETFVQAGADLTTLPDRHADCASKPPQPRGGL